MEYRTIELVALGTPGVYNLPREGDIVRDITIQGDFVKATLVVGDIVVWESVASAALGCETVIPYEINLIGIGYHMARLTLEAEAPSSTTVKATFVLYEDIGYRRRLAGWGWPWWWLKNEAHKYPERIERLFQIP